MEEEYTGTKFTLHTPYRNPISGDPMESSDIEEALATYFELPVEKFDASWENMY